MKEKHEEKGKKDETKKMTNKVEEFLRTIPESDSFFELTPNRYETISTTESENETTGGTAPKKKRSKTKTDDENTKSRDGKSDSVGLSPTTNLEN